MLNSLSLKILGIIGLTLFIGFTILGITTLWLSMASGIKQQTRASRDSAVLIRRVVDDYMMRADQEGLDRYISQVKGTADVLDLRIFNREARQRGNDPTQDQRVLEAFRNDTERAITEKAANGDHILTIVTPLRNEQRCRQCHTETGHVGAVMLTASLEQGYRDTRRLMLTLCGLGGSCFLLLLGGMYLFFRGTIIRNVLEMSETVHMLAQGEGDLTIVLPVRTRDEIGRLGSGINHLVAKLNEIISTLYEQAGRIALSTCRTMGGVDRLSAAIAEQRELAASVAVASEEMAATLNDVAGTTIKASELSRRVDGAAHDGQGVVSDAAASMDRIRAGVDTTLTVMVRLGDSSDRIGTILGLIEDVADQTNLLALNAAIEAARAGDAGRGFAVVANEVKVLSGKTSASTREIADIIKSIQTDIREAMSSIEDAKDLVDTGIATTGRVSTQIAGIRNLASESADMIDSIAGATEEQSATTGEISAKIHQVSETATQTQSHMEHLAGTFGQISLAAEHIYATVGRFNVDNYHCAIKKLLMELRDTAAAALERAVAENRISPEALFSTDYQPIPGTWPQKFSTPFDRLFDEIISPL
ncbi:methyl-accepting chemotaxis protein [Geobacter sp. SVR]|uniref:methyl-accepting chemotaxis protein n=1 Tax=Geobacter sp. SVR TaxID=2495594 RepID=UPI00143EF527|nr:methyl-accepting chemotaxis protein [Geobacter sp. SVR]BCS53532.1 methyl-accepting chemotaxis protein [Geobacter sp. SVR]GCF84271.1 methyl-accepting chemotaxis protein [Geobacter sp. SVR]